MALIFFMVIIINQFGTIIGPFIAFKAVQRTSQIESYHLRIALSFSNLVIILILNGVDLLANGQIIVEMPMVPLIPVSEVGRYRLMLLCHFWLPNKAFLFEPVNISRFKGQFPCQ